MTRLVTLIALTAICGSALLLSQGTADAQIVETTAPARDKAAIPEKIGRPVVSENVGLSSGDERDAIGAELKLPGEDVRPNLSDAYQTAPRSK